MTTIAALAKSTPGGRSQVPGGRDVYGVAWGEGDRILLGRFADGIWQVSASGGTPVPLTKVEGQPDTFAHRLPHPLPGGRGVVLTCCRNQNGDSDVAVLTDSGEVRVLVESAADGRFVPPDRLIFVREGVLHAAPFDPSRLELAGPAVPILEDVLQATGSGAPARNSGAAQLAVSAGGTLVFARGGAQPLARSRPVWLDRRGQAEPLKAPEGYYARPRLSPDGTRLAVTHTTEGRREATRIWVLDVARGAFSPVPGEGFSSPVWTPDGRGLVFRGTKPPGLYRAPADGTGEPELLREAPPGSQVGAVSADGALLAYVQRSPETGLDIWLLPLAGDGPARPWLKTSASESHPEWSPDGRWMAYSSNVSGRSEVYVQPFPGPEGPRHQVSLSGGQSPQWSRDGRELFFVTDARPRRLMAVDVRTAPAFAVGAPRELVARDLAMPGGSSSYEVSPDGRRFLVLEEVEAPDRTVEELQVVLNGVRLLAPGDSAR